LERRSKVDKRIDVAIQKGRANACGQVAKTAYNMAVSGKHPNMTIFWLKCRMNWSEVSPVELENGNIKVIYYKDEKVA
jgi:hypothetical protein